MGKTQQSRKSLFVLPDPTSVSVGEMKIHWLKFYTDLNASKGYDNK